MNDKFWMNLYKQNKKVKTVEFRAATFNNVMKRIIKELKQAGCTVADVAIMEWDDYYKEFSQADYGKMIVKNTKNGPVFYWDNRETMFHGNIDMGIVDPRTGNIAEVGKRAGPVRTVGKVATVSVPAKRIVPMPKPTPKPKAMTARPASTFILDIPKPKAAPKPKEKPITVDGLRLKGTSFYQVITKRKVGGRDTTSIVYSDFDPRNAFRELIAHQRKSKKPYTLLAGYVTAGGSPEYGNPDRSGKYTVIPGKDIGMTGTYLKEIVRNETRYYKILRNGMFLPIRK